MPKWRRRGGSSPCGIHTTESPPTEGEGVNQSLKPPTVFFLLACPGMGLGFMRTRGELPVSLTDEVPSGVDKTEKRVSVARREGRPADRRGLHPAGWAGLTTTRRSSPNSSNTCRMASSVTATVRPLRYRLFVGVWE